MKTDEFWKREGLDHIIPNTGNEFPEGFDVLKTLYEMTRDRKVIEVGCGYGRLASAFNPDLYRGYDINATAVEQAKNKNPDYQFDLIGEELPKSDIVLFYTVLLHISDADIPIFLEKYTANTKSVLVAEIMGKKWRRKGNPPVFNRELKEYEKLFSDLKMKVSNKVDIEYKRYPNTNITFVEFTK